MSSVNPLAQAVIPNQYKKLRACKSCLLIKSEDQFLSDGCENCPLYDYSDLDSLGKSNHSTKEILSLPTCKDAGPYWARTRY